MRELKASLTAAARWFRTYLAKPVMVLPLFVLVSREMEEYYPISHYPMYATIDTDPVWYVYVGDADRLDSDGFPAPVPMEYLFGIRPDKAKKSFQIDLKKRAEKVGRDKNSYYDLPAHEWTGVGDALLHEFRRMSSTGKMVKKQAEKKVAVPSRLALIMAEITMAPGSPPKETRRVVAAESVQKTGGKNP